MTSLVSWREIVVHRLSAEFTKLVSPEIPIAEASNAQQRRITAFDSAQLCCGSALERMTPKDRSLLGCQIWQSQSKNASDFFVFLFSFF